MSFRLPCNSGKSSFLHCRDVFSIASTSRFLFALPVTKVGSIGIKQEIWKEKDSLFHKVVLQTTLSSRIVQSTVEKETILSRILRLTMKYGYDQVMGERRWASRSRAAMTGIHMPLQGIRTGKDLVAGFAS